MSEEFDEVLIELIKTERATALVKVPKGVVFSRGFWWLATDRGVRTLELDSGFWQIDSASFEVPDKDHITPGAFLGCIYAGGSSPVFHSSKLRAWPTNAVKLDARPYLSGEKEEAK